MKNILLPLLFVFALITFALAQTEVTSLINEQQAIDIAKKYAIEKNMKKPEWFDNRRSQASFNNGTWLVRFVKIDKPSHSNQKAYGSTSSGTFFLFLSPEGDVIKNPF